VAFSNRSLSVTDPNFGEIGEINLAQITSSLLPSKIFWLVVPYPSEKNESQLG
jgi:hypothetical protein